jgi:hypothetical protein
MKISLLILPFIIFPFNAITQVNPEWIRYFNNENNVGDGSMSVVLDKNKNIIVVGTANDKMIVLKYSPSGDLLWERRQFNYSGYSVALDSADNIYALGWNGFYECKLVKYSNQGNYIWDISYSRPFSFTPISLGVSKNGNSYIHFSGNGSGLAKFNSNGLFMWYRRFVGTGGISLRTIYNRSIKIDDDENIYVAVCANMGAPTNEDIVLIKYNLSGDSLWTRTFDYSGGSYDRTYTIALDDFNNVYTVGVTLSASLYFTVLVKYNNQGVLQWFRSSVGGYDGGTNIKCKNGYVYITGAFEVLNMGFSPLLKYSYNGVLIWISYYNENNLRYYGYHLEIDNQNNVYSGGNIYLGLNDDIASMKLNSNGIKQWVTRYNGPGNGYDNARDMTIDDGKIIFTGTSFVPANDQDLVTIKYSNSIGIIKINNSIPAKYVLYQNYPNPFNPVTKIRFESPTFSKINIRIFDITGKEVKILINQELFAGVYEVEWNASNYPSGVYFYELVANNLKVTKKMVLIK